VGCFEESLDLGGMKWQEAGKKCTMSISTIFGIQIKKKGIREACSIHGGVQGGVQNFA
jgi:hypothetical protein